MRHLDLVLGVGHNGVANFCGKDENQRMYQYGCISRTEVGEVADG